MRRHIIGVFLLLMGMWLGTCQGAAEPAITFSLWKSGLELFQASIRGSSRSVEVQGVRIQASTHRIRVVVPELADIGATVPLYRAQSNADAAISGGFLKSFYPPIALGLVKAGGRVVNRAMLDSDLLNGLLVVRDGRPIISPFSVESCDAAAVDCLQAGPLLVQRGVAALPNAAAMRVGSSRALVEKSFIRAFVANVADDKFVLGVTLSEVTLSELVEWLRGPSMKGGLECRDALNLSGAGSAGMIAKSGTREQQIGNQSVYLPDAIVAVPR